MAKPELGSITKTPREWAREWMISPVQLACADVLHGWSQHEHHEGTPMQLTEDTFLDAISAVDSDPSVPAADATSPHRHRRM